MMISDYIREPQAVIGKDEPITKARALMRKYGERVAVIVDEKGKFKGFLTRREAAIVTSAKSGLRALDLARDYPVFTPETPLEKAFDEMISQRVWGAVVVDDPVSNNVIGVVTLRDIIEKFIEKGYKPKAVSVSEIMTKDKIEEMIAEPDTRVTKIWSKLVLKSYPAVILVRSKANPIPVGIITAKDLVDSGRWRFHREGEARIVKPAKAKAIMTRGVVVATLDTPIEYIAKTMAENDFSVIPVIDDEGKVIGVATQEDVVRAYLEGAKPGAVKVKPRIAVKPVPEIERITFVKAESMLQQVLVKKEPLETPPEITAKELVIPELPAMSINGTVEHARKLMLRHRVNYIAVIDDSGKIVGIVSKWNMLKAISLRGPIWRRRVYDKFFMDYVMTKNPPKIKPDESIGNIALKLLANNSDVALVEDENGNLLGFITKDNIVEKFVEQRGHKILVENVITPVKIGIVHPHHSLAHVINKMRTFQLDAITVADKDGIYGVVSANRLPFVAYEDHINARKSRRLIWVRKLVKGSAKLGRYVKVLPLTALDAAAKVEEYVTSNQTLAEALKKMKELNLDGIPVRDIDGKVIGIISKYDILREIVREAKTFKEEKSERKEVTATQ
ncbi:MAG: CBS domain-containing protein [Desulfurococcales archaeon]|nr:CBS domain-containing protein [Desulfurococcales archaeon]